MMEAKFSVLMSLYCYEKSIFLEESIESILNQTIIPNEIILVIDGPIKDELNCVLNRYLLSHPNIFKIVRLKTNVGLGLALNVGLKNCSNELVARMDTDDISLPNRFEKQLTAFQNDKELAVVGSYVYEFDNEITKIIAQRKVPINHHEIFLFGKKRSPFNHPSVMYKKSIVLSVGGYNNFRRNQDFDLFGRLLYKKFKCKNIPESLVYFRANTDLKKRRKSWQNTWSYIFIIWKFYKNGYSSLSDLTLVTLAQIFVFLSPLTIQEWFYKKLLR